MLQDLHDIDHAPLEPFCIGDRVESFHPAHKYMIPDAKVGVVDNLESEVDDDRRRIWFVWVKADNGRRFAVRPSQLALLGVDEMAYEQPLD